MSGTPSIPVRTSSKRGQSASVSKKRSADSALELERDGLNKEIQLARKRLKPTASFSSEYWFQRSDIAKSLEERGHLTRKLSLQNFCLETGGDEADWIKTPDAQKLIDEIKAHELDQKLCTKQAKRLQTDEPHKPALGARRTFMKFFTTSYLGLGISRDNRGNKRDDSVQSNFKADLIKQYNARHPDNLRSNTLWCSVLGEFLATESVVAAHIFPSYHGQETMTAIFGKTEAPELFTAHNGILMCKHVETLFDSGNIVIVPSLPDDCKPADIQAWHHSDLKPYKIRIINKEGVKLDHYIAATEIKYRELDNRKLVFRSSSRPRARQFYYHYCVAMLRRSWNTAKSGSALHDELGKKYWGTAGSYMSRSMLLAFVEEMGHDYDELLEGATEDSKETEPVETALAAANNQIKLISGGPEALSYEVPVDEEDLSEDEG